MMDDFPSEMTIVGVDMAWGERRPDGVCALAVNSHGAEIRAMGLTRGDDDLLDWIDTHGGPGAVLLAVDAPVVCPNDTGARPVDRLTHVHFRRNHAGSHPSNRTRCGRPLRLVERWKQMGYTVGFSGRRVIAEVYPHPAMVRLFGLEHRIPYKRGPVSDRRVAFQRLQTEIRTCIARYFPGLTIPPDLDHLLKQRWIKDIEDQTDGVFCALIGYWHWMHQGKRTQIIGDLQTGFILVPRVDPPFD